MNNFNQPVYMTRGNFLDSMVIKVVILWSIMGPYKKRKKSKTKIYLIR